FGVLPLSFADASDYDRLDKGDTLKLENLRQSLADSDTIEATTGNGKTLKLKHQLSARQVEVLLAGGLINWMRERQAA
ncbi:MAG: hypothetical protein WCD66_00550, partial [Rhodanobacteraceae bacterium]